jgi:hypothetical protein
MRHDLFQDRKCVHIKLEKETHAAFRAYLFKRGISMQEAFDEFAKQVAEGLRSGTSIVEAVSRRKLKDAIEGRSSKRRRKDKSFGELDSESLYHLINGQE